MPLHTRSERLRRLRGDVDSWTVGPAVGVNRFGLTKVRPPTVYQTIGVVSLAYCWKMLEVE